MTTRQERLGQLALLLIATGLGLRGITDEASVMLSGDMARYVMNGVFLRDFIAAGGAWTWTDVMEFAERYYARYPALSLGHHPPLPSVALVPALALFGVSLWPARFVALAFFLLAAWGLYMLVRGLIGWQAACWATLLFVTNLVILRAGQYLLSEMPMLALVLVSFHLLMRYCDTGNRRYFAGFIVTAAASLYAKQLAIFLFPIYAAVLVGRLGWRHLVTPYIVSMTAVGAVLVAPLAVVTIAVSKANMEMAMYNMTNLGTSGRGVTVTEILGAILRAHLLLPSLLVVAAGAAVLAVKRLRVAAMGVTWIAVAWTGTVALAAGVEPARYAFGAMPAYCLLASGLATVSPSSRGLRRVALAALGVVCAWQLWTVRDAYPSGAGGYETAAVYALEHSDAQAIMFDGLVDTGYFAFFVRKHDAEGRHVILRADQLIKKGEDVLGILQRFGVKFVVAEEGLRHEERVQPLAHVLKTEAFIERLRVPIRTTEVRAQGAELVVYEFRDARPPDPDAEIVLGIRLARREIRVPLKDLLPPTRR